MRKGKYPGGRKNFIYDKKVWNGGVSDERVEKLWERHEEGKRARVEKEGGGVVGCGIRGGVCIMGKVRLVMGVREGVRYIRIVGVRWAVKGTGEVG